MRDSNTGSLTAVTRVVPAVAGLAAVVLLLGLIGGPGVFSPSAASAQAQTVTLEPIKDNTLYEDPTGSLSNGAGPGLFASVTGGGGIRRGLVAFDVASALPAGATVVGASLTLRMSQTTSGQQPVQLHRLLADWGEGGSVALDGNRGGGAGGPAAVGDATWTHTVFPDQVWTNAGGDFSATVSASASVDGIGPYTWSGPGMVGDVQAWLDDPASNFGWVFLGNEAEANRTSKRFDSREHGTPANRPQLEVQFTLPEPPTPTPTATPTPAPTPTPLPSTGGWGLVLVTLLMAALSALYLKGAIGAGRQGT